MDKNNNKPQFLLKLKLILAAFAFLLFANSLKNGYGIDDTIVTAQSPMIQKGFSAIPEIFSTNYYVDEYGGYEYRPIVKLTYAVEYGLCPCTLR